MSGWLERFKFSLPSHAHILDLGCGGGEPIPRYFIDNGHQVTGIDNSEKVIALARMRFPRQIWLHTDMQRAALSRQYEGILAWDSFFLLNAACQIQMIAKVGAWLSNGGVFLFNSSPAHGSTQTDAIRLSPEHFREAFKEAGLIEIAFSHDDSSTHGRDVWLLRKR